MSLIDQVKFNIVYYRAIKISVIAIVSGLAFFLLIWIGIWFKVDEVRSGGMILFAISVFVAFTSYLFALAYTLLYALRKLLTSRKEK